MAVLFDLSPDGRDVADPVGRYRPTPMYWLITILPLAAIPAVLLIFLVRDADWMPPVQLGFLCLGLVGSLSGSALHVLHTAREITVTERTLHWRTLSGRGAVPLDALVDARSSYLLKVMRLRIRDERTLWLIPSLATRQVLEHLRFLRKDQGGLAVDYRLSQTNFLPAHTYQRLR
ncbi:hypothetical protein [Hamadaea tsunoensis]|uniref:hypothetical protein n=1 Tax=Hamadaea tsunoensis TaxID=53368 RepID=UPI0004120C12|nr:hypothetical protein [Hamadaea tsunoensis]